MEPLIHCNHFLLTSFQDHFIFYQKNWIWTDSIKTKILARLSSFYALMSDMKKRMKILMAICTYKSVVTFPLTSETVTSNKLINVWDHSGRNFIIRCFSFNCFINSFNFSSPCFQRKTMSSMCLHRRYCFSFESHKISFLTQPWTTCNTVEQILYQ